MDDTSPDYAHRLRILIVEDQEDSADTMALLVRAEGYSARVARDGSAALAAAKASQPHVILLDIGLPGIDGWEVARQLADLGQTPRPFIVAITGYGQDSDRRQSAESGIDVHWVKPVDPAELLRLLQRFQHVVCV